jgi:hypothetical protein
MIRDVFLIRLQRIKRNIGTVQQGHNLNITITTRSVRPSELRFVGSAERDVGVYDLEQFRAFKSRFSRFSNRTGYEVCRSFYGGKYDAAIY